MTACTARAPTARALRRRGGDPPRRPRAASPGRPCPGRPSPRPSRIFAETGGPAALTMRRMAGARAGTPDRAGADRSERIQHRCA